MSSIHVHQNFDQSNSSTKTMKLWQNAFSSVICHNLKKLLDLFLTIQGKWTFVLNFDQILILSVLNLFESLFTSKSYYSFNLQMIMLYLQINNINKRLDGVNSNFLVLYWIFRWKNMGKQSRKKAKMLTRTSGWSSKKCNNLRIGIAQPNPNIWMVSKYLL